MRRILTAAFAAATLLMGCRQNGETKLGPDSTLEEFYRNLCSGQFTQAEGLCDKTAMEEYLNGFRSAWAGNDSTTMAMASDILAEMSIEITDTEQNSQSRIIFYKLTAADGQSKEKIATLKKEEGEWRITAITDRH